MISWMRCFARRRSTPARRQVLLLISCVVAASLQAAVLRTFSYAQRSAPGAGHGFLIDKHMAAGLACGACHTEPAPAAVSMATCLSCHGGTYANLAARTTNSLPNPHASHRGEEPCGSCHHVHVASETVCNQCHSFDMITP